MAVAFDAASESHTGTTDSTSEASFTWNHGGGTPKGVVVFVMIRANTVDLISSVTYGGVSMTAVPGGRAVDATGENGTCKAYFLGASIPTGTQAVVVNRTNNATGIYAVCFSVSGAADTEIKGTPTLQEDNSTLGEFAVDSGSATAIRFCAAMLGGSNVPGASASSTAGPGLDFGTRVYASSRETTPGSGSRNVGLAAVSSDDCALVALAVGEISVGGEETSFISWMQDDF